MCAPALPEVLTYPHVLSLYSYLAFSLYKSSLHSARALASLASLQILIVSSSVASWSSGYANVSGAVFSRLAMDGNATKMSGVQDIFMYRLLPLFVFRYAP
jgi:hypothetical protein